MYATCIGEIRATCLSLYVCVINCPLRAAISTLRMWSATLPSIWLAFDHMETFWLSIWSVWVSCPALNLLGGCVMNDKQVLLSASVSLRTILEETQTNTSVTFLRFCVVKATKRLRKKSQNQTRRRLWKMVALSRETKKCAWEVWRGIHSFRANRGYLASRFLLNKGIMKSSLNKNEWIDLIKSRLYNLLLRTGFTFPKYFSAFVTYQPLLIFIHNSVWHKIIILANCVTAFN